MSNRPTRHPALETQEEIKESLEIGLRRRGDPLDGFVTFRDLTDSGIVDARLQGGQFVLRPGRRIPGGVGGPGVQPIPPPGFGQDDLTRPPRPTGVRARGMNLNTIGVTWSPPGYNNHAYAEVFASFTDSWSAIAQTFNAERPIGPGNQTQFFMGTASGTMFLHSGLGSTVPVASTQFPLDEVDFTQIGFVVAVDGDVRSSVEVGDTIYLSSNQAWNGNGIQAEVIGVIFSAAQQRTIIQCQGPNDFDPAFPDDTVVVVIRDPDELEQALNPTPVYYWVRFVSTANVAGPVQGEQGAAGTVMANPTEILNILTGRIRSTQLAQDLITPINFIRGPVNEVDEDGNRLYPTVRDFVLAQGDAILTEYDEILLQIFLGTLAPEDSPWAGAAAAATLVQQIEGEVTENSAYIQVLQTLQAAFEEQTATGLEQIIATITQRALVQADDQGALAYIGDNLQVEFGTDDQGDPTFIFLNEVGNQIVAVGDQINQSWTVKLQQNSGDVIYSTGFGLGLETDLEEGTTLSTFAIAADQFALMSSASGGRRALQVWNAGTTGYRITVSTRATTIWSASAGQYQQGAWVYHQLQEYQCLGTHSSSVSTNPANRPDLWRLNDDGLMPAMPGDEPALVTVTVPFDAPANIREALRARTFELYDRQIIGQRLDVFIRLPNDEPRPINLGSQPIQLDGAYAVFPEQQIPFIVDTASGTIGIRGRLIVDGMITTTDLEVTRLLRANEIWAIGITAFGLIQTSSLIGETIATPRFGGWALKMTSPDTSYQNRVFEFSRWLTETDEPPDPESDDILNQADQFPQLRPDPPQDTSFWLDAQGRVYVRGSLQVGGNTRILTLDPNALGTDVDYRHFVQMDNEFPLMVFPFDQVTLPGMGTGPHQPWAYNNAIRSAVRQHALFWVNKDGTAGFNTRNNAIFVGDTPMEPPSGYGYVEVKTRLQEGQWTGMGRVWVNGQFQQYANRDTDRNLIFCTYGLFLVPASANYFTQSFIQRPSARNSMPIIRGEFQGQPVYTYSQEEADFVDSHFLFIRHPTSFSQGQDPAWQHYQNFKNNVGGIAPGAIFLAEFTGLEYPGGRMIQGFANAVASSNYRALIVIAERMDRRGRPVFGLPSYFAAPGDDTTKLATMPVYPTIVSQQVSKTPYGGETFNPASPGTPGPPGDGQPPPLPPTLPPGDGGIVIP